MLYGSIGMASHWFASDTESQLQQLRFAGSVNRLTAGTAVASDEALAANLPSCPNGGMLIHEEKSRRMAILASATAGRHSSHILKEGPSVTPTPPQPPPPSSQTCRSVSFLLLQLTFAAEERRLGCSHAKSSLKD